MFDKKNDLVEKLQEELEDYDNELDMWTDSLRELGIIEDAFEVDEQNKLRGKTFLDIGTDCIKPLYIALKFEPDKIIGINEDLYRFASDLEKNSTHFTKTEIKLDDCSFFDKEQLTKILEREKIVIFSFVLVSKALHHLRTGECIAKERDQKHKCREDEKDCIYKFDEQTIFKNLLQLGKRVIIYECYVPQDEDDDKIRGRGGHFSSKEWYRIFKHLSENYKVEIIKPLRCHLDKKEFAKVIAELRQVDCICFYVEKNNVHAQALGCYGYISLKS